MLFDDVQAAHKFYKDYADDANFQFIPDNIDVMTME
jgi:myo-inositol-1-phosphate synthase